MTHTSSFILQVSLLHRTDILFSINIVIVITIFNDLLPLHEIKINAHMLMRPSGDASVHASVQEIASSYGYTACVFSSPAVKTLLFKFFILMETCFS